MKQFAFLLLITLFSISCKKTEDPIPVIADFEFKESTNGEFTFTNKSTGATNYEWDFGSGKTSTEFNPKFSFPENQTYSISLTAKGAPGQNQKTKSILVTTAPIWADKFVNTYSGLNYIGIGNVSTNSPSGKTGNFTIKKIDKKMISISPINLDNILGWNLTNVKVTSENTFEINDMVYTNHSLVGTGKLDGKSLEIRYDRTAPDGTVVKYLIKANVN